MNEIFDRSELLLGADITDSIIERLVSDSKLSEEQLFDLIVKENPDYLFRMPDLFIFLDFWVFKNWTSILDNFMDIALQKSLISLPAEIREKMPQIFQQYIERYSCLLNAGVRCSSIFAAVGNGHILCSKKFYDSIDFLPGSVAGASSNKLFFGALANSDLKLIKWLYERGVVLNYFMFLRAVYRGNLEIIKWLCEVGCPVDNPHGVDGDSNPYSAAYMNNKFEIMEWLFETGFELRPIFYVNNIRHHPSSDTKFLEWLYVHNCPYDKRAVLEAVKKNNLPQLKWLIEHDFPFNDDEIFIEVARKGTSLELFQYLMSVIGEEQIISVRELFRRMNDEYVSKNVKDWLENGPQ
jgi:hypothetical protein